MNEIKLRLNMIYFDYIYPEDDNLLPGIVKQSENPIKVKRVDFIDMIGDINKLEEKFIEAYNNSKLFVFNDLKNNINFLNIHDERYVHFYFEKI